MKNKPLSYWIPEWMASAVRKCVCTECETKITKRDTIAAGIRNLSPGKDVFFLEYRCSNCEFRTILTFEDRVATLRDLCYTLLEEIQNRRNSQYAVEISDRPQGKMNSQETEKFLKFVKECKTHDEFMKFIGLPLPKKKAKPKCNDEIQDK